MNNDQLNSTILSRLKYIIGLQSHQTRLRTIQVYKMIHYLNIFTYNFPTAHSIRRNSETRE